MLKLNSLESIKKVKEGDLSILKSEKWLMYLYLATETRVNLERVNSVKELKTNLVLDYVERTLQVLDTCDCDDTLKILIEKVLMWSEVAKTGSRYARKQWLSKNYNLQIHNEGSAQIYMSESKDNLVDKQIVKTLIQTHGFLGQFVRGEINFANNQPISNLFNQNIISGSSTRQLLETLNRCVIEGVSPTIWDAVKSEIDMDINSIVDGRYDKEHAMPVRLKRLRSESVKNGEDVTIYKKVLNDYPEVGDIFKVLFSNTCLWYVEPALRDFSFEEFVKIFLIVANEVDLVTLKNLSFEALMSNLYYDYDGHKAVNLYKKRIVQKYLREFSINDIINGVIVKNEHICFSIFIENFTATFDFKFSEVSLPLINFCEASERSKSALYKKSIIILYDLFGFREDKYDRLGNESTYLANMNDSMVHKSLMLDYVTGETVLDVGPGGGGLLDLLTEKFPDKQISGVDISQNVIDTLTARKHKEGRLWDVQKMDVLDAGNYIKPDSVDTIIFSSIIHELYSYIPFQGKKFNKDTIATALKSTFNLLKVGGRIIIRDGIMTESDSPRIIEFKTLSGVVFFNNYVRDFEGRKIEYKWIDEKSVWLASTNDAMEFLYTYTWGESSYVHEVQEQFGYFTPFDYIAFINKNLGDTAEVIECKHYLQEGYAESLLPKITLYDEYKKEVTLPDSTCLIVIEKKV